MDDKKMMQALGALRAEVRQDLQAFRREVREDLRDVREQAFRANASMVKRLVGAIVVLGLALGGKDLLALALDALP